MPRAWKPTWTRDSGVSSGPTEVGYGNAEGMETVLSPPHSVSLDRVAEVGYGNAEGMETM